MKTPFLAFLLVLIGIYYPSDLYTQNKKAKIANAYYQQGLFNLAAPLYKELLEDGKSLKNTMLGNFPCSKENYHILKDSIDNFDYLSNTLGKCTESEIGYFFKRLDCLRRTGGSPCDLLLLKNLKSVIDTDLAQVLKRQKKVADEMLSEITTFNQQRFPYHHISTDSLNTKFFILNNSSSGTFGYNAIRPLAIKHLKDVEEYSNLYDYYPVNENLVYFTHYKEEYNGHLKLMLKKKRIGHKQPEKVKFGKKAKVWKENIYHIAVNSSDTQMVFSAKNKSNNSFDLYISQRLNPEANWSTPILLDKLNTAADEILPFWDGLTLYFTSDKIDKQIKNSSKSGFNLWGTTFDNGHPSTPNLLTDISTPSNDYGMFPLRKENDEWIITADLKQDNFREKQRLKMYRYHKKDNATYHLVYVGIDTYTYDHKWTPIPHALKYAEKFDSLFTQNFQKFAPSHIILNEHTKREKLVDTLSIIFQEFNSNDRVVFIFSSHGTVINNEGYWIPQDGPDMNKEKWISFSSIKNLLIQSKAKDILLISDACHSGKILDYTPSKVQDDPNKEIYFEKIHQNPSRNVFTSSLASSPTIFNEKEGDFLPAMYNSFKYLMQLGTTFHDYELFNKFKQRYKANIPDSGRLKKEYAYGHLVLFPIPRN